MGDSSSTIYERNKEHWQDWRSKDDRSHILSHQVECHDGEKDPQFIMKTVRFFKTALSCQVGEAVRIMRRGGAGAILHSKSECDRCKIPRLILEDQDNEERNRI